MQLVTEELFVNTLHHGYGCECDAEISLALTIEYDQASLTFLDHAPPFNLLQREPLPASAERMGGVGLNLIRALSGAIRYQRVGDCNITILDFKATPSSQTK